MPRPSPPRLTLGSTNHCSGRHHPSVIIYSLTSLPRNCVVLPGCRSQLVRYELVFLFPRSPGSFDVLFGVQATPFFGGPGLKRELVGHITTTYEVPIPACYPAALLAIDPLGTPSIPRFEIRIGKRCRKMPMQQRCPNRPIRASQGC